MHARIVRWCGLKHICCSNPVPTLDSGQSSPRVTVLGNGLVVMGRGVGKLTNVVLHARLETYTNVQV